MKDDLFAGIDVGGTKIAAAVVDASGKILSRKKSSTPQKANSKEILETIITVIKESLDEVKIKDDDIKGIGLGIPGIVEESTHEIMATPNIDLAGFPLAKELEKKFKTRVALGNDVNCGLLAEQWLGAAKGIKNVIGIFPGTGVGGAIIIDGKLLTGSQGAAAEIGHMIMEENGPECGCGNHGCLEALISRRAIEREIRQAVKKGEKTIITELTEGDLDQIKSKFLKKALKENDPLVVKIMTRASEVLGVACISLRHIFNPDLFVLGGGVMEACGEFMLPIVQKTFSSDPFFSKIDNCKIVQSRLEDDAVILGAVALVKNQFLNS